MSVDLAAYLDRVGHAGPVAPDLPTLRALHRAHLRAIPYENFDVQLKRPRTTDPEAAFDKLVHRRRGGWCYEMNGAFGAAIAAAGFNVTRLSGGMGERRHMHLALIVDLEGETYACDVGFGDGPIEPFRIVDGPFSQDGYDFRLEMQSPDRWQFHNHSRGLVPGFDVAGPDEAGMAATCQYLQTSADSPFVQHAIVMRRAATGPIGLIDRGYRATTRDGVTTREIVDVDDYMTTLRIEFGVDMPEVEALWPQICAQHEEYKRAAAARAADQATS